MTIMNRSKMNLPREYFLGLRLRVIVIPFKRVVVFGAVGEMPSEPLVILSEPRQRFLARLRGKLRPKGAEPAIVGQPPLELVMERPAVTRICGGIRFELSDLVIRFEQLFDPALVFAHPVVTRMRGIGNIRFE